MAQGKAAGEAVAILTEGDERRAQCQVGIVDAMGRGGLHGHGHCHDWAGSLTGEHHAVQGNILTGRRVVEAMAGAYEAGDGDLCGRLLAALDTGQAAEGDPRGKQSAALLVVRGGWRG